VHRILLYKYPDMSDTCVQFPPCNSRGLGGWSAALQGSRK